MALQLENISNDVEQEHILLLKEGELKIYLRYLTLCQNWICNIEFKNKKINGIFLKLGVNHFLGSNLPCDIVIDCKEGVTLDPHYLDCFADDTYRLYILQNEDIEVLRGVKILS